ncbi:MAG: DNA adenine methylase [Thermus sp.]
MKEPHASCTSPGQSSRERATPPDRPVLRYYGGKWRLAPWILRHFPPHEVYTEAFGGSAAVLLRKPEAPLEV